MALSAVLSCLALWTPLNQLQIAGVHVPYQFLGMAPYVVTMIVLAGLIGRVAPAAVGLPYSETAKLSRLSHADNNAGQARFSRFIKHPMRLDYHHLYRLWDLLITATMAFVAIEVPEHFIWNTI